MIYFYLFCGSLGLLTFALIKKRDLVPAALLLALSAMIGIGMVMSPYHWMGTA